MVRRNRRNRSVLSFHPAFNLHLALRSISLSSLPTLRADPGSSLSFKTVDLTAEVAYFGEPAFQYMMGWNDERRLFKDEAPFVYPGECPASLLPSLSCVLWETDDRAWTREFSPFSRSDTCKGGEEDGADLELVLPPLFTSSALSARPTSKTGGSKVRRSSRTSDYGYQRCESSRYGLKEVGEVERGGEETVDDNDFHGIC